MPHACEPAAAELIPMPQSLSPPELIATRLLLAKVIADQQLNQIMRQVAMVRMSKTAVSMHLTIMASRHGLAKTRGRNLTSSESLALSTGISSTPAPTKKFRSAR